MDEAAARFWCHSCSRTVNPIIEVEFKCPLCRGGFVEEMESASSGADQHPFSYHDYIGGGGGGGNESESDRALSLWAPILLGMISNSNPRRRRRFRRRLAFDDEGFEEDGSDHDSNSGQHDAETELDRELESIIRRRRRSSATILQLLQGIRAGMLSESDNPERENTDGNREGRDRENGDVRARESVILINPFSRTIIVQGGGSAGSYDSNNSGNPNHQPLGSLGDYFIGPGLELLLQHLAENDPNRYGTPPAQKEAVEAMPTVKVDEILQCSVCLDDLEIGTEAKEMPCKHKFHSGCILPWLELHSSCPVCRYQLPSDESKLDSVISRNDDSGSSINNHTGDSNNSSESVVEEGDREERSSSGNGRRFSVPLPWPLSLFSSSSGNGNPNSNSSSTSSPSSSTNAPRDASHTNN